MSSRSKFWSVVIIIVLSSCLGGIFGNWIFEYGLDALYGLPNTTYTSESAVATVRRSAAETASDAQVANAAEEARASLVHIARRRSGDHPIYLDSDSVAQAFVLTADGWLISIDGLTANKSDNWQEYVAITSTGKKYDIERVVVDPASQLSYIHLLKAGNLPVRDFQYYADLSFGQSLFGLGAHGEINRGMLGEMPASPRLSDGNSLPLKVSGLGQSSAYVIDVQGRLVGLSRTGILNSMDSVNASFEQLLKKGSIQPASLGIWYVNLAQAAYAEQDGFLISAPERGAAVVAGTAAARAGLQAGDIITAFDNVSINSQNDLALMVAKHLPGDAISIEYSRKGEHKKTVVVLDALKLKK